LLAQKHSYNSLPCAFSCAAIVIAGAEEDEGSDGDGDGGNGVPDGGRHDEGGL
jgi:hypothetical protein